MAQEPEQGIRAALYSLSLRTKRRGEKKKGAQPV